MSDGNRSGSTPTSTSHSAVDTDHPGRPRRWVLSALSGVLIGTVTGGTVNARSGDPAPDPDDYGEILDRMQGEGTEGDPYVVRSVRHLQAIAGDTEAHYKLGDSLDAEETKDWNRTGGDANGFTPIAEFSGTLNGDGNPIKRLTIARPDEDEVGLFSELGDQGVVEDLVFEEPEIVGRHGVGTVVGTMHDSDVDGITVDNGRIRGTDRVGGLVGESDMGSISESSTTGVTAGHAWVGGLVGTIMEAGVSESYTEGDVEGDESVGGLVGAIGFEAGVVESYATGSVTGNQDVGGLAGSNGQRGVVIDSRATGTVTGGDNVGGLLGTNAAPGTKVTGSSATGQVDGDTDVGGLIGHHGFSSGPVAGSYATGAVTGDQNVGGFIGATESIAEPVSGSYATGAVEGTQHVGGFVGSNRSSRISASYSTGRVEGTDTIGGFVGHIDSSGSVDSTYATGSVDGDSQVGGLVGSTDEDGSVSSSYWDVPATGREDSDGGVGLGCLAEEPPADEMIGTDAESNMDGFDFTDTWAIIEDPDDYPVLVALDRAQQIEHRNRR